MSDRWYCVRIWFAGRRFPDVRWCWATSSEAAQMWGLDDAAAKARITGRAIERVEVEEQHR